MNGPLFTSLLLMSMITIPLAAMGPEALNEDLPAQHRQWRAQRELSLKSPTGYLALTGLRWLENGTTSFGIAKGNDWVLPGGRGPERAGVFRRAEERVTLTAEPGTAISVRGEEIKEIDLLSDAGGRLPTQVRMGDLTFWLIERAGRIGVRLRDPASAILREYENTPFYPYDVRWRVTATFKPAAADATVEVPNILGAKTREKDHGSLTFTLRGTDYKLTATDHSTGELFIIFGDGTNAVETYGGGRFLRVAAPGADRQIIVDFNYAYNPPCAYNPHTTCPMPPPANRLPVPVEAGEKRPSASH
ncbi:MAG: DUF1684 domain-containing protein [Planctomycetota bacterium]|jgi:uncharacterized protein (DUF1684 family)